MAKLYGKGRIREIEPGKKYHLELSGGKRPGSDSYLRARETFLGTRREAELRIEEMRKELQLTRDLLEIGIDEDDLQEAGLTVPFAIQDGMNAAKIKAYVAEYRERQRCSVTYAEVSDAMLTHLEKHGKRKRTGKPLTNRTKADYRTTEKHIVSSFIGPMLVADIQREHIMRFLDEVRDGGLGETSTCKCLAQMRRVLERARRDRLIVFNPCDDLDDSEKPVKPMSSRKALSKDDIRHLVDRVISQEPTPYHVAVLLGACNGMRIGEILGLSWRHIEFDGIPHIVIEQQFTALDGVHQTKADERHLSPLDAVTVDYLRRWKDIQYQSLNEIGIECGIETPVCTSEVGTRINTSNFENWWRRWCVGNGYGKWIGDDGREIVDLSIGKDASLYDDCIIEWRDAQGWPCSADGRRYSRSHKRETPKAKRHYKGLVFHELRHSWASHRLDSGMNYKVVQSLGGWSTPDMLLNVYGHALDESVLEAGGYMDSLLAEPE